MSTTIQEYSTTEAALATLTERYKGVTYDVAATDGMIAAKKGRAELRGYRTALEAKRVEIKAPALQRCKDIDAEAKRIEATLLALEEPIAAVIKAEEGKKAAEQAAREKAEADRVAELHARIAATKASVVDAVGKTAGDIEKLLHWVENGVVGPEFGDLASAANEARAWAAGKLRHLHASAAEAEAARAELDRRRTEQAERDRVEQARMAEEIRARFEAERQSRMAIEEQERASRERIEAEERAARTAREAADETARQARIAEQARLDLERQRVEAERQAIDSMRKKERETAEAKEREEQRRRDEVLDARAMLTTFVERYGSMTEFALVVPAITSYLRATENRFANDGEQPAAVAS